MKRIEITRRSLLRAGGAFGALSAGLLPPFALARATPIKVGFVVPLTGPYGVDAQAEVKGAELAIRQFNNEGGLNGRRAELVVRDDKLNPGEAASKASVATVMSFMMSSLPILVDLARPGRPHLEWRHLKGRHAGDKSGEPHQLPH